MNSSESLVVVEHDTCHECDLRVAIPPLQVNQKALCPRCGFLLAAKRRNALNRMLAFALTALIFLALSLPFHFISFKSSGLENEIKMLDSVTILISSGYGFLAVIEVITVLLIPMLVLISLMYVTLSLKLGRMPWQGREIMALIYRLLPWNMAEIFLVGTLVSLVKIISLADIHLGPSFFAFILFSISMTATLLHIDKRSFNQAFASCAAAANDNHSSAIITASVPHAPVQPSLSIQRTWALIITSILLYIPANILPIMNTRLLGQDDPSTIIGGVLLLWHHGSYPIAMVIFVASVMVPIIKILVLIWLNYSVQTGAFRYAKQRIRWYRLAEFVGRWSMIDIFVVIILASLVQLGNAMSIVPGSATFAFAAVVIVTMLAAMSFEPKLIYNDKVGYEPR
ncbi:paraquat-inducible protein A [Shewanella sp. SNU WT4]|uniref:paraquat-inducible protein A n=1 Tax=Shewanella sp. SNU WT4 TaxID=2590015 RepID=UPI001F0EEAF1|nr:paraquat-inducible protein A [Shewanella sp. SNU WT4]